MKLKILILLILSVSGASAYYISNGYISEAPYTIQFSTSKAEGSLSGLTGTVYFKETDLVNSSFDVAVDVATIKTGNKLKDRHARNGKWMDASSYPNITYTSQAIEKYNTKYKVTGLLTIKGISKEKTIIFDIINKNEIEYLKGTTTVTREEYGIEGNSFAFLVGDEITVDLEIPASYNN